MPAKRWEDVKDKVEDVGDAAEDRWDERNKRTGATRSPSRHAEDGPGSDPTGLTPSPWSYAATLGSPARAIATSSSEYSWSTSLPAKWSM